MLSTVEFDGMDFEADADAFALADAEQSFALYVRQAWHVVEPSTPYLHNWHIDCLAEHLTAVTNGWVTRLLINIPPRYSKSRLVSVLWPTWEWGPKGRAYERWVFATWDAALASDQSTTRRFLMTSEWYRARWGDRVRFSRDQNQVLRYTNTARGTMFSTTVGSGSLGHGGNRVVLDDPHNTKTVESDAQRQAVLDVFDQDFSRRLNDKARGAIVLIMQRLHEGDMSSHFREIYPDAVCISLPVEADGRSIVDLRPRRPDESEREFAQAPKRVREDGELLWPEREGPTQIAEAKLVLGARGFASQYGQRPSPKTGAIFHPDLFHHYKLLPPLRRLVGSWDTAQKKGEENDFWAYSLWGQARREYGSRLYLLHMIVARMTMPEGKRMVRAAYQAGCELSLLDGSRVPCNIKLPDLILIEDKSSGSSVGQELAAPDWDDAAAGGDGESIYLPIEMIQVDRDKEARAHSCTPMLEAGFAVLPDPAVFHVPWLSSLLESMRKFPASVHKDDVDCVTQALNYLKANDEPNMIRYYREQAEKLQRREKAERERGPTPPSVVEEEEEDDDGEELIRIYEDGLKEHEDE